MTPFFVVGEGAPSLSEPPHAQRKGRTNFGLRTLEVPPDGGHRKWGLSAEQCGAVTFIQRFGSALNLHVHFHTLVLDSVYPYELGGGRPAHFLPLPPPEPDEVERVLAGALRWPRDSRDQRPIRELAAIEDGAPGFESTPPCSWLRVS